MRKHFALSRFRLMKRPSLITFLLLALGFLLVISFAGCDLLPVSEEQALKETQLKETQLEVNTRQTLAAQQLDDQEADSTFAAQQATLNAQATQLAQGVGGATQLPSAADINAAQATQDAATKAAQQTADAPPPPTDTPKPTATVDMKSRMKTANILIFEDMAGRLDTHRYAKDTLDTMGLPYVDVGSAKGWLKSEASSDGPDGKGWDLVIIAAESKSAGTAGEYFEYTLDLISRGASVILEVWYLNKMHGGAASTLMIRCGIEYEGDMIKVPPNRMVMFPLNYEHPIMREPNGGLTFTDTVSYWWGNNQTYDTGDLVKTSLSGDATLLIGTMAEEKQTHGTVTVCMDDRLILQTFSSHNLTFEAMQPLWENYIYNALRVRFESEQ